MKILLDIGHPAHVHYFKFVIKNLEKKGHKFLIIARNKDVTHQLLQNYSINFISRGKGSNNLIVKFFYLFYAEIIMLYQSLKFKPDVFMSFASPYACHVSYFLNKPHYAFTDTEHANILNKILLKYSKFIITPKSFKGDFGEKHIRFNGFFELCYLHPNYFIPEIESLNSLGIDEGNKYVILRFVSWGASHDKGLTGMDIKDKRYLVRELSKFVKVFISSESELPDDLKKYQIKIDPHKMHDIMAFCSYFLGESGTMAAECAILGTPAIQISGLKEGTIGTLNTLDKKYNLIRIYEKYDNSIFRTLKKHINDESYYKKIEDNRTAFINKNIDVTSFIAELIESYNYENKQ